MTPIRLACLLSGGGRTLLNIADRIDEGVLPARVELVITSRECRGLERARHRGFVTRCAPRDGFPDAEGRHDAITGWLRDAGVDLVCLCGYLSWFRVDPPFADRVINIHPALLPRFGGRGMYGDHVHRAVLEAGCDESGCTVHFVDDQYDHGPIILERRCPVHPDDTVDTLAARVFAEECIAYPDAIRLFAEDRVRLADGVVTVQRR